MGERAPAAGSATDGVPIMTSFSSIFPLIDQVDPLVRLA
jgi:hypothetical protein